MGTADFDRQLDPFGDGSTRETALLIPATFVPEGIAGEYAYLASRFGEQNVDWRVDCRTISHESGRTVETFRLSLRDRKIDFHFDISWFYRRNL